MFCGDSQNLRRSDRKVLEAVVCFHSDSTCVKLKNIYAANPSTSEIFPQSVLHIDFPIQTSTSTANPQRELVTVIAVNTSTCGNANNYKENSQELTSVAEMFENLMESGHFSFDTAKILAANPEQAAISLKQRLDAHVHSPPSVQRIKGRKPSKRRQLELSSAEVDELEEDLFSAERQVSASSDDHQNSDVNLSAAIQMSMTPGFPVTGVPPREDPVSAEMEADNSNMQPTSSSVQHTECLQNDAPVSQTDDSPDENMQDGQQQPTVIPSSPEARRPLRTINNGNLGEPQPNNNSPVQFDVEPADKEMPMLIFTELSKMNSKNDQIAFLKSFCKKESRKNIDYMVPLHPSSPDVKISHRIKTAIIDDAQPPTGVVFNEKHYRKMINGFLRYFFSNTDVLSCTGGGLRTLPGMDQNIKKAIVLYMSKFPKFTDTAGNTITVASCFNTLKKTMIQKEKYIKDAEFRKKQCESAKLSMSKRREKKRASAVVPVPGNPSTGRMQQPPTMQQQPVQQHPMPVHHQPMHHIYHN